MADAGIQPVALEKVYIISQVRQPAGCCWRNDALSRLVGFQQSELEHGCGIRDTFPFHVYANEASDGLAILDSVLNAFIGLTKALLRNVYVLYANWWSATADALGKLVRYRPQEPTTE